MKNIRIAHYDDAPRAELHDVLELTGCEASLNSLPAGAEIPFVHFHKQNEELYIVTAGSGTLYVDGEITTIAKGDCFKIDPEQHRCMKAGADGLAYVCVQAKAGSLEQFTMTDAGIADNEKPIWVK